MNKHADEDFDFRIEDGRLTMTVGVQTVADLAMKVWRHERRPPYNEPPEETAKSFALSMRRRFDAADKLCKHPKSKSVP